MRIFVYQKPSPHTLGEAVRDALIDKLRDQPPLEGPVNLRMRFIFFRPSDLHRSVPQLDEPSTLGLARAVMNQLPGLLYQEEKQVVSVRAVREYGNVNAIEIVA